MQVGNQLSKGIILSGRIQEFNRENNQLRQNSIFLLKIDVIGHQYIESH